jgi:hypothetical protein
VNLADINGDGFLDAVTAAALGDNFQIYFQTGNINDMTVCAWIKLDSMSGYQRIAIKEEISHEPWAGWGFSVYDNKIKYGVVDGINSPVSSTSTTTVTDNETHHVCGVMNVTHIMTYINGVEEGLTSVSAIGEYNNRDHNLGIGKDMDTNDYFFNGTIDDVRIHNRALSPEEINASYNAGTYRLYNNFTGLSDGKYSYIAYVQNESGSVFSTDTRYAHIYNGFSFFNISESYSTVAVDILDNVIDADVPVELTTISANSIKWNSSQNYTAANWKLYVLGDKTDYYWSYQGHFDAGKTAIQKGDVTYDGTYTLFDLYGINVGASASSNELTMTIDVLGGRFSYIIPTTINYTNSSDGITINYENLTIIPFGTGTGNATINEWTATMRDITVCTNDTELNMSFVNLTASSDIYIVEDNTWYLDVTDGTNYTFNATTGCKQVLIYDIKTEISSSTAVYPSAKTGNVFNNIISSLNTGTGTVYNVIIVVIIIVLMGVALMYMKSNVYEIVYE